MFLFKSHYVNIFRIWFKIIFLTLIALKDTLMCIGAHLLIYVMVEGGGGVVGQRLRVGGGGGGGGESCGGKSGHQRDIGLSS